MMQCPNCGAGLRPDQVRCVKCGSMVREAAVATASASSRVEPPPIPAAYASPPLERRNAALAAVLSLIVCGLGQVYNGQFVKGVLFFVAAMAAWCVLLGWAVHVVAAIEAWRTADAQNRRIAP
jgi:hypothetical protein